MSGHSKWSQIKRQKGATDAKRGQLFTKLTQAIIIAVREGGNNPDSNFKLRLAIDKARQGNMPMDNIERAIKRGAGEGEGILEELTLEGYGPGGVAILVQALTNNHNRTVQEVRGAFTRNGGSLGESGCVSWLFDSRGVITVDSQNTDPDEVAINALDAAAEDAKIQDGFVEVYTKPDALESIQLALKAKGLRITSAEVAMVPKTRVELDEKPALQTLRLLDKLEELDDVQNVSSNADFSEEVLEKYQVPA